tara:strand:- start:4 stop:174 length:171 start_codon:yes stop_codon:yes gene_type:complete
MYVSIVAVCIISFLLGITCMKFKTSFDKKQKIKKSVEFQPLHVKPLVTAEAVHDEL